MDLLKFHEAQLVFFFHIFLSPSPGDLTSIEFLGTRFVDLLKFHKTKLVFF